MMKLPNSNYKFTDKKFSPFSIMSAVLSGISFVALFVLFVISYSNGGNVEQKAGATSVLCAVFSLTAIAFSIRTYFQRNVFHTLSHIGLGIGMVNLFYLMYIYGIGLMA